MQCKICHNDIGGNDDFPANPFWDLLLSKELFEDGGIRTLIAEENFICAECADIDNIQKSLMLHKGKYFNGNCEICGNPIGINSKEPCLPDNPYWALSLSEEEFDKSTGRIDVFNAQMCVLMCQECADAEIIIKKIKQTLASQP